jgi:transcriptional regulator with XRE-family HTH domain
MTVQEISTHIGRRLNDVRISKGLSLAQVASRCGVSLQQIHRYETGDNTISAPMLWSLAKCLDVEIGYFFEGLTEATACA